MSSMEQLYDKLRRVKPSPADAQHWERQKKEWLEDLTELRERLRRWMKAGEDQGLLRLEPRTIEIDEPDLGTYSAPALDIRFFAQGERVVRVEPKGMGVAGVIPAAGGRFVGFKGRVDLICGPARAALFRGERGHWQFVALDRAFASGGEVVELSEDALAEVLGELIE